MSDQPVDPFRADPFERAKVLERAHEAVISGRDAPRDARPVIVDSWRRSLAAKIDPERWEPPVTFGSDQLSDAREAHPLASCVPLLRRTLLDAADGTTHIMIVTDADGNILWREGHPDVCRAADAVRLSEGTGWAETTAGTNAMGTTLATGAPIQIHSAEHLVRTYHSWTCAACPVHDPETGRLIGSIDLSGPLHTMHPALMALVAAAARIAEGELRGRMAEHDERVRERNMPHLHALRGQPGALLSASGRVIAAAPHDLVLPERIELDKPESAIPLGNGRAASLEPLPGGYLLRAPRKSSTSVATTAVTAPTPDQSRAAQTHLPEPSPSASASAPAAAATSGPRLNLRFMDGQPRVRVGDRELSLSLRHAELLTVLALRPGGLNAEQLALAVHGESGNPVTVRAEIHRLRAQLGKDVVRTKPYRIDTGVDADFVRLRRALLDGEVQHAVELHGGGLLPLSEAPAIRDEREELVSGLRSTVLSSDDPDLLWEFTHTDAGREDIEAHERLLAALGPQDWRRASTRIRLDRLLTDPA